MQLLVSVAIGILVGGFILSILVAIVTRIAEWIDTRSLDKIHYDDEKGKVVFK